MFFEVTIVFCGVTSEVFFFFSFLSNSSVCF